LETGGAAAGSGRVSMSGWDADQETLRLPCPGNMSASWRSPSASARDWPGLEGIKNATDSLGSQWTPCHRRQFGIGYLSDHVDIRTAIEDAGKSHEDNRSTSGTLNGAIAHAVAILAKISRRQGDVLHCGECHSGSPLGLVYRSWNSGSTTIISADDSEAPH